MDKNQRLTSRLDELDAQIDRLETSAAGIGLDRLDEVLDEAAGIVNGLLGAYAEHAGKVIPVTDDLLAVFKAFVKGDPSLNAVRDNVRELVYYRNCLDMGRADALPPEPARMAAHTARHIHLYLRSRCEQEGRLS
jgi:hypothetical protein